VRPSPRTVICNAILNLRYDVCSSFQSRNIPPDHEGGPLVASFEPELALRVALFLRNDLRNASEWFRYASLCDASQGDFVIGPSGLKRLFAEGPSPYTIIQSTMHCLNVMRRLGVDEQLLASNILHTARLADVLRNSAGSGNNNGNSNGSGNGNPDVAKQNGRFMEIVCAYLARGMSWATVQMTQEKTVVGAVSVYSKIRFWMGLEQAAGCIHKCVFTFTYPFPFH